MYYCLVHESQFLLPCASSSRKTILSTALTYIPFAYMTSYPVLLFMGKLEGLEILKMFGIGIRWAVLLMLLGKFLYSRALKHLVVFGG